MEKFDVYGNWGINDLNDLKNWVDTALKNGHKTFDTTIEYGYYSDVEEVNLTAK